MAQSSDLDLTWLHSLCSVRESFWDGFAMGESLRNGGFVVEVLGY